MQIRPNTIETNTIVALEFAIAAFCTTESVVSRRSVGHRQSQVMKAAEKTDNNREMPRATMTCTRGVSLRHKDLNLQTNGLAAKRNYSLGL